MREEEEPEGGIVETSSHFSTREAKIERSLTE